MFHYYTTDPDTLITGQVWFDKTNKVLQFQAQGAGAWATGGNLNFGREQNTGLSVGTQTAGLLFGGDNPTPGGTVKTEEYNGSSWTASNDINYAAGNSAGLGTQTAAVLVLLVTQEKQIRQKHIMDQLGQRLQI